jgi:hypothetical protein
MAKLLWNQGSWLASRLVLVVAGGGVSRAPIIATNDGRGTFLRRTAGDIPTLAEPKLGLIENGPPPEWH